MRVVTREDDPAMWDIQTGDSVDLLKAAPACSVRLLFADPPYNIGVDYGQGKKADRLPPAEYLAWCRSWMGQIPRVLADDGAAVVLINWLWLPDFVVLLRETGLHRRTEPVWFESFGNNNKGWFNSCHRHLCWFTKHPKRFVFNRQAVNRPSDRLVKYRDKRAKAGGKNWDSVWGIVPHIPRLCGTHGERIKGLPTQLPLKLLVPLVGCASDEGDLVLDPFSGSGTTGEAAISQGRRFLGFERNAGYAEKARERLRSVLAPARGTMTEQAGGV
jgi:DNA modification methylase